MKFGLFLAAFTSDPGRPLQVAARAARAGYDSVFVYDHLFPPGGPDRPSIEPFTLLSAAVAANPGLGAGVLVTRPGFRPLGILAKEAASLALLTGDRAVLGLGLGDKFGKAEHAVLGLPYPPPDERAVALEETSLALRALFRGAPWPGGASIGPVSGPLLPAASAEVWIGGTSERVVRVAARAASAWNGWGMDIDRFTARAAELATWARDAGRDPAEVPPTWAGIVLVGEDAAALATLEADRATTGGSLDVWRGTIDDLRRLRDRVHQTHATWMIPLAAGPADRLELVADTLRS
jgi:alkanesulfonate monooxygenase SsuD/methylene tetrahydromethanopterin reductase-like flavin-dependent oxidoreductase (luciferase family)